MPSIAVLPGDGIGHEVLAEGLRVLAAVAPDLTYEHFDLGAERYLRDGTTMPDDVLARFRDEFDCVYLGALGDPRVPTNVHAKEILLGSRFKLDLYINFRPIRLLDARYCPLKDKRPEDVDFVVFRENTEGLYTGVGGQFAQLSHHPVENGMVSCTDCHLAGDDGLSGAVRFAHAQSALSVPNANGRLSMPSNVDKVTSPAT